MPPQDQASQASQAPQKFDPKYDYVPLSDGSYAEMEKGLTNDQIKAKLIQNNLMAAPPLKGTPPPLTPGAPAPAPAKPQVDYRSDPSLLSQRPKEEGEARLPTRYGFTAPNMLINASTGIEAAYEGTKEMANTLFDSKTDHNVNRAMKQFVLDPGDKLLAESKDAWHQGRYSESFGLGLAAGVPILGPVASELAKQAGKGDIGGATGKAMGMYLFGKGTESATGLLKEGIKTELSPQFHKRIAAYLNNKVAKLAEDGTAKDYNLTPSLQAAHERITGGYRKLAGDGFSVGEVEKIRIQKGAIKDALAAKHDAAGHTADAEAEIGPIIRNQQARLNSRGLVTGQVRAAFQSILKQISTEVDFKTGATTKIDLSKLTIKKALELTKGLGTMGDWTPDTKTAIKEFVNNLRDGINNAITKVDPEITKARLEEHNLIEWRNGVRAEYARILDDKVALGARMAFKSFGTIGSYLALKALFGAAPAAALGTVIVAASAWNGPLSRTTRAALHSYVYESLESIIARLRPPTNAPATPSGPSGPGAPILPQVPPKTPTNAGGGGPTGAPAAPTVPPGAPPGAGGGAVPAPPAAAAAASAPAAPSFPASYADAPKTVSAAGAGKGGANYTPEELAALKAKYAIKEVKSEPVGAAPAAPVTEPAKPVTEPAKPAVEETKPAQQSAAKSSTTSKPVKPKKGSELATKESYKYDYKYMYDNLISERKGAAKSGMEAEQIKKMTAEMEHALSGKATTAEMKAINKHIADRMRVAGHRATASSQTASGAPSGAGASQENIPSPVGADTVKGVPVPRDEARLIALEEGYAALSKLEGGKEWVANLKNVAKTAAEANKQWDEVEALHEATNLAKKIGMVELDEPLPRGPDDSDPKEEP
jgi:hypothetical protein